MGNYSGKCGRCNLKYYEQLEALDYMYKEQLMQILKALTEFSDKKMNKQNEN